MIDTLLWWAKRQKWLRNPVLLIVVMFTCIADRLWSKEGGQQ
jgi:hypothetical protein